MTAVLETLRGGLAILRWLLGAPWMSWRAGKRAANKADARRILTRDFNRVLKTCGIEVSVSGTPPSVGTGCVVCYNETSFADVFAFPASVLPHVDRAAAADAYAVIPFARSACLQAGIELVPRGQRAGTNRLMDKIVEALRAGERIAWGGEGQLSGQDGVRRFKRGAFLLAIRAGVPVVPVAFYGGHQALPLGSLRARAGTIHVRFGDPIDSSGYDEDDVRDLADHVQAVVASMYADLKSAAQTENA